MFHKRKYLAPVLSVLMIVTLLTQQSWIVRAVSESELGQLAIDEVSQIAEKPEIKTSENAEPVPAVVNGGVGSIDLQSIILNGSQYQASGIWAPAGNNCWNPGNDFQFRIDLVDATANQTLNIVNPAPCNGVYSGSVDQADRGTGGNWPANGQSGNTFTLTTPGTHSICAILRHANGQGNDVASDCQDVVIEESKRCVSPLDYNDVNGVLTPDYNLSLSDAVEFTKRYEAAKGTQNGDAGYDMSVDINYDGKVSVADYFCAQPYYGNAGPYTCQLDCSKACVNPIDYNHDYEITLSDASVFTGYYTSQDLRADLNQNGEVDYGDYNCSLDQIANADYQCPIQCAPTCGDHKTQARLGEQCDDGNHNDGDGCSATCKVETACDRTVADYNHDGVITLSDAVLFTPYYLNQQTEGDVDTNGETRLHDKICMDNFLNEPTPVVYDTPTPIGVPPTMLAPIEPTISTGSNGSYNLDTVVTPQTEVKSTPVANLNIGPVVTVKGSKTESTVKKIALNKTVETPTKTKRNSTVITAPAGKPEAVVNTPAVSAENVPATVNETSILDKIVGFISGLFR